MRREVRRSRAFAAHLLYWAGRGARRRCGGGLLKVGGVRVSTSRSPRAAGRARVTTRLPDLALDDRDRVYRAPNGGDWLMVVLLVAILLANGFLVWHQLGQGNQVGRAVFFGFLLLALFWTVGVYVFKLSLSARVGPHGLSIVRGPWRTDLLWAEVARLAERTESEDGSRHRWVVAQTYDGRRLQVREDMVTDYQRFRLEIYERYRQWEEHGGTWGTAETGPFTTADRIGTERTCWLLAAGALLLAGSYFLLLVPGTLLAGLALLLLGLGALGMGVRAMLERQRYVVGPRLIASSRPFRPALTLEWGEVARVDRSRHPFGWLMRVAILLGKGVLGLAARTDGRVRMFSWSPGAPEYLTVRGAGRQIRIRLHRLERPDELLAWVEYYERQGRRPASQPRESQARERQGRESQARVRAATPSRPLPTPDDLTGGAGPADPWGGGRGGDPAAADPSASAPNTSAADAEADAPAGSGHLLGPFVPWNSGTQARPPLPRYGPPLEEMPREEEPRP